MRTQPFVRPTHYKLALDAILLVQMLSRLFHATTGIFQASVVPVEIIETTHSSATTDQIQAEFADAARKDMLVTREQSDGLLGQNVLDRRSGVPSEISIKKRRIVDDADRILDRTEMESVNQPPMVIGASKLVHRGKESIHNSERAGVSLLPTNATQIVPSKTLAAESLGPMEKQSATSPSKLDKALSPELSASRKKRKADMQTKGSASGSGVKPNVTSQGPVGSNGTLSAGKSPTKRTHRRFQSEEPDVIKSPSLERDGQAGIGESTTEPDEISNTEDEEPETVSASIGLDQSRIPVADAAKAIERLVDNSLETLILI